MVATARAYTGQGSLPPTSPAGPWRTSSSAQSAITDLPTVNHESRPWEPEPLRWLGARYVQRGLTRVDDRAESTGEPPTGKTLAERLGKH